MRRPLPLLLLAGLLIPACHPRESAGAWDRFDLEATIPTVESTPAEWKEATLQQISYLGAAEVRDMRLVPAKQLAAFPKRSAGQVTALEQRASSRVRWTIEPGRDAYFSFVPLGNTNGCQCLYRVGLREGDKIQELAKVEAEPAGPFAPAAVEVDLSLWAGHKIDLLLQVDGSAAHAPEQPVPGVLWGSPAVYSRRDLPAAQQGSAGDRPNILLIGIDTLRAEALGAWGREPSPTPSLDRLASESDVWPDAYTVFNVTNPSFISMMTGLYGKNHGVYDLKTPLPPGHVTLARKLSAAGYYTLALISASHLGDHNSGLGQGFAEVQTATEQAAAEKNVDATMSWLAYHSKNPKPFFIWLHLFDPHTPHTPPEPYALGFRPAEAMGLAPVRAWIPFRQPEPRGFTEQVLGADRDLYYGEVAYLDRQVGRLMDFLASRGLLRNTVVAVVADHGENLGEHGIRFRHVGLFDTTTHVPLMIRWPDRGAGQGRRFAGLVQTIDLYPTLLAAAGLKADRVDGQDLRELTGNGRAGRRAVFSEHAGRLGVSVRTSDYRYGLNQGNAPFVPDGPVLYDLKADPQETQSLAGRGLPVEKELNGLLLRWLADHRKGPAPRSRDLTEEEAQRLKALGYAGGGQG
ncbi:MAG TPA: sulfatase [Thermoanaerobaculia bacterium]